MLNKMADLRTKPHFNLGTLGHVDHGKSTTAKAILRTFTPDWEQKQDAIDKSPESRQRGITISIAHVELETDARHYALIDCPGHKDFIKNMITGAAQLDGALLVISSVDGAMPQTREHVLLAKQVGVPKMAVLINKFGATDADMLMLIEEDARDMLKKNGYDANAPVFVIDSYAASNGDQEWMDKIKEMFVKLEEYMPIPEREVDKPFLMPVEDVFSITGRGTVVTGRVERGTIKVNEEIEVLGLGKKPFKTVATGLEMFHKSLDSVMAGDNVGILVRGIERTDVERGMVVAKPGSVQTHSEFEAEVYVLKKEEGGRHTAFVSGYRPQFYMKTADVTGNVTLPEGTEMVVPGDNAKFKVELIVPVVMEEGMRFAIREGGITIGQGVITKILK